MIPFFKMSGSGNDFILIDNREHAVEAALGPVPVLDFVRSICRRVASVGADGLILIERSDRHAFRWRFFNADGSEVEMCGNGGRCAARFAFLKKIAGPSMSFETAAGVIDARVSGDIVKLRLTDPTDLRLGESLPLGGRNLDTHFVNTGVPHVVHFVEELDAFDVFGTGRAIRYHEHYAPRGTNANFVRLIDRRTIQVRTYERGVEDETLACGTGSVASVLIAAARGLVESPVDVRVQSGEVLKVHFEREANGFSRVYFEGRVQVIYEGTIWEEAYRSLAAQTAAAGLPSDN
ncbi:MAG: diaminopimelate epimerase [Syntrophaceae bacterium]|nr:diaminopimelate epimerase [Syntrophaceae bacterium]